jgi:hypothetical protein
MEASGRRFRRALLAGATAVTTAALVVAGVTSSAVGAAPKPKPHAHSPIGPGYPPPGGIYTPFTNCPLLNPLMQESVGGDATGCIAGDAVSGSITIGKITTLVAHPVTAQFGLWGPPNATPLQYTGGILPPNAGLSAQLVSSPEFVPGGLNAALGCPGTTPTIEKLCQEAKYYGGKYLNVYALAQSAGPITNFNLTTWTQPTKFKLINPLLGANCYIGSNNNPVMVNPSLSGTISEELDPNPAKHPNTGVLVASNATASDATFAAPGVTGCGPGGSANIAVDEAIDTNDGLPAASGTNSLTLNGTFYIGVCFNGRNQAKILLSAFADSVGTPPPPSGAGRPVSMASLRNGRFGF